MKEVMDNFDRVTCGCGLAGVAESVGIFGSLGTYGWKIAATARVKDFATQEDIKAASKSATTGMCKPIKGVVKSFCDAISNEEVTFSPVVTAGKQATATTTEAVQNAQLGELTGTSTYLYSEIGY
ncbi:rifin PIR protein, putative [Plasmodium reichenowi]|uniref:Rifin PIR protein, putative n=1 Tax=Plasmodium reichenowi TaxID=5854 RepID=A0A2P9DSR6_PLARE|nr:rifin PIR protein, putative [Plasmodium reichenowi]